MSISRTHVKWGILLCSVIAYIYSLVLPALLFEHDAPVLGGTLLMWGWWGFLMFEFAWLANPIYLFAVIAYILGNSSIVKRANIIALLLIVVTTLLALTSFHAKEWYFNEGSGTPIIGLGTGFYVWMLSFLILLISCLIPSSARSLSEPSKLN